MRKIVPLRRKEDFRSLFRRGRGVETPLFRVRARPNSLGSSRWAFIVPKSVDKRSTVRNRLRRRAREWIRKHTEGSAKIQDVALVFKKKATTASRKQLYEELGAIFR